MLKNPNYLYGARTALIPGRVHFGEFMLQKLWHFKNNVALINAANNETLKYGEIAQQALNLAVSLHRLGVQKGDIVAVISENRFEYFSTIIGVACVGATLTLINPLYKKDELLHAANISKPKYVICSKFVYDAHCKSFEEIDTVQKIILYDNVDEMNDCISYKDLVVPTDNDIDGDKKSNVKRLTSNVKYEDFVVVDVVGQVDTLFILYSSGTLGKAKGVILTHFNAISMLHNKIVDYVEGPISVIGPWFHVMGLFVTSFLFREGLCCVFIAKFNLETYLSCIKTHQVTMLFVAPAILVAMLKHKGHQYDWSSVRRIYSGSAPLHSDVIKKIVPKFPNLEGIVVGYGLTETTIAITLLTFDNPKQVNGASVGKAIFNIVIKIAGPNEEALGPNQTGEIRAKGDTIMKGYIGGDTAAAFDDEGFFKTGDIGYYDKEGYLYVVDRIKELIKYKGNQVPPAELEAILLQHEAVKDAGVIGLPDEEAGELPLAFVSLRPGMTATEKEIQDFVAERISKAKHLRGGVRFVPEIPKNTTGKILRHELKKLALSTCQ